MSQLLVLGTEHERERFAAGLAAGHSIYSPELDSEGLPCSLPMGPDGSFASFDAAVELSAGNPVTKAAHLEFIRASTPGDLPLLVNSLTMTATAAAAHAGKPVVGFAFIPATFPQADRIEVASSLQAGPGQSTRATDILRNVTGRELEIVVDRVALVSARVLVMIINEAAFALMEGVAGADDIDTAMKLGTNYPEGPLRWGDTVGLDLVVDILQALHDEYQEERYRPCVLLKQYARAGMKFYPPQIVQT